MALYPLVLDLATARSNLQVQGRAAWLSAWTVNATVVPSVLIQDPGGTTRTLLVTLPVTVQTPLESVAVTNAVGSGQLYLLMSDNPCDQIAVGSSGGLGTAYAQDNYDVDLMWPPLRSTITIGGAWEVNASPRQGTPNDYGNFWNAGFGAGTGLMNVMFANGGWVCGAIVAQRLEQMIGWPIYLNPVAPVGVPASWRPRPERRVWRLAYTYRHVAGLPGVNTGVGFSWSSGVAGSFVQGAFGLVGNGGGIMQVVGYLLGPGASFVFPVPWPVAITVPVNVEWVFQDATGAAPAAVELWVNDTRVWTDNWLTATMPYPVHSAVANANKLLPWIQAWDAGNEFRIANVRCRSGRFNHDGVEVA